MSELTQEEIEGIVHSMSDKKPTPRKPTGKVAFSPLTGEPPKPLSALTAKERSLIGRLTAQVDVVYGQTTLPLETLMSLEKDSLLPLNELCDDLVTLYVNGIKIGRGEIVATGTQFGVKIVSLDS